MAADAAVLAEPTGGLVEAGCQGTMRAEVTVAGRRAHTARPWAGINAIHRLAPVFWRPRGLHPAPGRPRRLRVHRAAPGRSHQWRCGRQRRPRRGRDHHQFPLRPRPRRGRSAEAELRRLLSDAVEASGDSLVVVDAVAGALPGLDHPLLAGLVAATGQPPRAKLGWTDVATLAAAGVPATNFGPGDPLLAHTPTRHVSRRRAHRRPRRPIPGALGGTS
jgi:succinyl-diaminopimelate desuccinylase